MREPKMSRAGSVDYGLNYSERRSKAKRRRDKGFSQGLKKSFLNSKILKKKF